MLPFHKVYLKLFHSLNFNAEKKLLEECKNNGVSHFLIIKRSWFYGLKLFGLILISSMLLIIKAYIFIVYFDNFFVNIILSGTLLIIGILILYDSISYLISYKNNHESTYIENDIQVMIQNNSLVNKKFIKFFNLSVLSSLLLLITLVETLIFWILFYTGEDVIFIIIEILLIFLTYSLIVTYRRRMMNLELDFSLVIPKYFYVINQKGVLSSRQCIIPQNIKTIEGGYSSTLGSLLGYGNIRIFLEGNIPEAQGLIKLDHVQNPDKVVNLINKIL